MTRPALIQLFNDHLRGYARRTRARAGGIADYFVFYLRQIVRYRYQRVAAFSEFRLLGDLHDQVHANGNEILRLLDRDTAAGGERIKAQLAERIIGGRIIERPLFRGYKRHFRGSRVTARHWQRYNTSVCTLAVLRGFLAAHDPLRRKVPEAWSFNLGTRAIERINPEGYPQPFVTASHLDEALEAVGLTDLMWTRHTEQIVQFDFYQVFLCQLYSDALFSERFHLRRWWIEALEQHRAP